VVSYDVSDGFGRLTVEQPDSREVPLDLGDIRYEWDLRFNETVPLDMEIKLGAGDSELELDSLTLNSLRFEGGAGDATIDLSGSTLRDMDVRMGAGDVSVDLSGNWQQDLAGDMKGGIGRATLFLPNEVGVRVRVQGGLGQVNAAGLNRNGDVYTNDAYGESEVSLEIDIEGGIGEINLELSG
jgi:predicted membrane protein